MNQDSFNMEIRQFLKKVGITSQREITNIVNQAVSEKKLTGHETLKVKTKLTLTDLDYELEISGDIALNCD
jgi:hypothetical protein